MSGSNAEKEKVERLRYLVGRLSGDRWIVERDDGGVHLLSFRSTDDSAILATFNDAALRNEIEMVALALDIARTFLDVGDRAGKIIAGLKRELGRQDQQAREKDYTKNAAITVKEREFWRFLEVKTALGPVRTETAADTRLKSVLAIKSKKDLNKDPEAAQRWLRLARDYKKWKGQGEG